MKKESKGQQVQKRRISDSDQSLLKSLFQDNEPMLMLVRNLLLGFDMTAEEKEQIKNAFKTEESRKLMRKIFLPELQKDIPIGQNLDLWMTIEIAGKDESHIRQTTKARTLLIAYLEKALGLLADVDGEKVDISVNDETYDWTLIARNTYVMHIEQQLLTIRQLANEPELTPEEALANMKKDSTR
jgi:hypothetical protein